MRHPLIILASTIILCAPASGLSATLWVEPTGLFPFTDVQDAVDAAAPGDVILVFPGTYGPVVLEDKDLILHTTGGRDITTIDAGGTGSALVVRGTVTPVTLIAGFTFTGGTGTVDATTGQVAGGGVLIERGARPRLGSNRVEGNVAEVGAGLAAINAAPLCYDNEIHGNVASIGAGGLFLGGASPAADPSFIGCNDVSGNDGGGAGALLWATGDAVLHHNTWVGNTGVRGGLWIEVDAAGTLRNNTIVANEGSAGGASGLEITSPSVAAIANAVAWNTGGPGVVRAPGSGAWQWSDVFGHSTDFAGLPAPTGIDGNIAADPLFTLFTPQDPYDDDLSLSPGSPLLGTGDPDPLWLDDVGIRNSIGASGGPSCDDGDGVRVGDADVDCRPEEAAFHPYAYELDDGLDLDCDGWGTTMVADLVLDDGGASAEVGWSFGPPPAPTTRGVQSASAWCFGPGPAGPTSSITLAVPATALPTGAPLRLRLEHSYAVDPSFDAGIVEVDSGSGFQPVDPDGGYPGVVPAGHPLEGASPGAFRQSSDGYVIDTITLDAFAAQALAVRLRLGSAPGSGGGQWCIGRWAVGVADIDGDGRATAATDCDINDASRYVGAPEIPYDSMDQDCDGADLDDVDADGAAGLSAGGTDCDDLDATTFPGASEVAYDGVDQDCDGADVEDADADGALAAEVGGPDCDDADSDIGPHAEDLPYDGIDQDCDGEDLIDVDGDGFAGDIPSPWGDCDDLDPSIHPDGDDLCGDGLDSDCDGAIDFRPDLDGDGVGPCDGDCDDAQPTVGPGFDEACDGLDSDCDGSVGPDEADADDDGVRPCADDCDDDDARIGGQPDICDGLDNDCDDEADEGHDLDGDGFSSCTDDCDDQRAFIYPGGAPVCEGGLDGDCDGQRDDTQGLCDVEEDGCGGCATGTASGSSVGLSAGLVLLLLPLALSRRRTTRSRCA